MSSQLLVDGDDGDIAGGGEAGGDISFPSLFESPSPQFSKARGSSLRVAEFGGGGGGGGGGVGGGGGEEGVS